MSSATYNPERREIALPQIFSFIDEPEEALRSLRTFVSAARDNPNLLFINQEACEQIDLCAGSILNELAAEASRRLHPDLAGRRPRNPEAIEIVNATGLPARLGLTKPPAHFFPFPEQRGGKHTGMVRRTASVGAASSRLADYIEKCFKRVGYDLTREAKKRIGDLTGEVLGNVHDHVPQFDWILSAYMRQPSTKPYGDCHIVVFNFGPTIAETLQDIKPNELRAAITDLVESHRERNFFGLFPSRWTEEELWTLYALQEGVTRLYGEPGEHHGIGTAEMIEAFQQLGGTIGGEQPKMCLLSGRTHITFDGKYQIQPILGTDGVTRRQIAFNPENDLELPPADGTVRHLKGFFPGTLISLRFYMHEPYLIRQA